MIRRKPLEKVAEFAENEDLPLRTAYHMIGLDVVPVMLVGERGGIRIVTAVWQRMLDGEPMPEHLKKSYVQQKGAA